MIDSSKNERLESILLFCRFEEEKTEYEKTLNIKLAKVMERELSKLRSKNKKMQLLQFLLAEFPYANKKFVRKSTLEVQVIFPQGLLTLGFTGLKIGNKP